MTTDNAKSNATVIRFSDHARRDFHNEQHDKAREIFMREMKRRCDNVDPSRPADGSIASIHDALAFAVDLVDNFHKTGGGNGCGIAADCIDGMKASQGITPGVVHPESSAGWRRKMMDEAFKWHGRWVDVLATHGKGSRQATWIAEAKSVTDFAMHVCEVAERHGRAVSSGALDWCPLDTIRWIAADRLGKTDGTIDEGDQ